MNTPIMTNTVLAFSVACIAKATVVWAVAALEAACLRKSSAASRHFVWAAAVFASLALPLLTSVLPAWRSTTVARAAAILAPTPSVDIAPPSELVSSMSIDAATSAFHVTPWLIALWALGAIALGARLFVGLNRAVASSKT